MSTSSAANSTSASAPTTSARSGARSRRRASARFRCRRWWSRRCVRFGCLARRGRRPRVAERPRQRPALANIVRHGLQPSIIRAGVVTGAGEAKYTGLHSLRHFYARWCINRRVDGGLELPLKLVQARLGHATIAMTADLYGHLFPRGDDGAEWPQPNGALLGVGPQGISTGEAPSGHPKSRTVAREWGRRLAGPLWPCQSHPHD